MIDVSPKIETNQVEPLVFDLYRIYDLCATY